MLYTKLEKCKFYTTQGEFLGYIILPNGVEMDPKKIEAVMSWPDPTNLRDVQGFLGFINFYCRFINHFSLLATPLMALA